MPTINPDPNSDAAVRAHYQGRVFSPRLTAPPPPRRRTQAPRKQRARPWSLARVARACRSAPVVWLALNNLADARRSAVVTPTRANIADAGGLRSAKTVSAALTILEAAGWIERVHVPVTIGGKRAATLLRIMLRRRGRKTTHTARARRGRKTTQG